MEFLGHTPEQTPTEKPTPIQIPTPDTTPPPAITSLVAANAYDGKVNLWWDVAALGYVTEVLYKQL